MTTFRPILAQAVPARNMRDELQMQHRTLMKPQPVKLNDSLTHRPVWFLDVPRSKRHLVGGVHTISMGKTPEKALPLAPWRKGDTLWVREPGRVVGHSISYGLSTVRIKYLSDGVISPDIRIPKRLENGNECPPGWVYRCQGIPNGIFKEAARTFLRVKRVWVHRIQDITEAECMAEGVREIEGGFIYGDDESTEAQSARGCFANLWESIYPGSWERNDWVWAEEHERIDTPEGWPNPGEQA